MTPDRIWAWTRETREFGGVSVVRGLDRKWAVEILPDVAASVNAAEYIRADLIPAMIAEAVAKEREACAALADDFHWDLPFYESREVNEATDDAACAVMEQIAAAIRNRKDTPPAP